MEFACGDLGLEDPAPTVLVANPVPQFLPASEEESGAPSNLVAQNTAPSPGGSGFPVWGVPAAPMFPGGGGGGGTTPGGGGGTTPGGGGGGDTPVPPPPPPPPPAQTPEPGTLVLMATGLMGAAGMLRRRIADRS
jgi:hypothetical protein